MIRICINFTHFEISLLLVVQDCIYDKIILLRSCLILKVIRQQVSNSRRLDYNHNQASALTRSAIETKC